MKGRIEEDVMWNLGGPRELDEQRMIHLPYTYCTVRTQIYRKRSNFEE